MANTLQAQFENIESTLNNLVEEAKTNINGAVENAQSVFGTTIEDVRVNSRKAALATVGFWAIAFDNAVTLREKVHARVETATEEFNGLFDNAVERGEVVTDEAEKRVAQVREEAAERFNGIESRVKETFGRAEAVTEDIEVVATEAVEKVVEAVAPFADYAEMTAKNIVAKLDELTNEQLQLVLKFETANANRVTVIREVKRRLNGKVEVTQEVVTEEVVTEVVVETA